MIFDGTDLMSTVIVRDLEDRLIDVVLEQGEDNLVADPVVIDEILLAFVILVRTAKN